LCSICFFDFVILNISIFLNDLQSCIFDVKGDPTNDERGGDFKTVLQHQKFYNWLTGHSF